ncbi:germin-like protein 9-3 [Cryptomeria japonica]|uniref:germin-like protein 9-3 n=1 Tax=Cryptomeria japonica TaxID=3369 RepID=UPI0027D9F9EF|nr:germin-like protein 9-3 [Cryptomeria japonica]
MEFNGACLIAILVVLSSVCTIYAFDPDILTDFVVLVGQSFFTSMGFRDVLKNNLMGQTAVKVMKFPAGGLNPPHTHPRDSEHLFLVDGSLLIGVVDTMGKLFMQTLTKGDLFVFPKGLFHYQLNMDADNEALAVSAFGSANEGTVLIPSTLFTTSIPDDVLAKSFKINTQTIELLKGGL